MKFLSVHTFTMLCLVLLLSLSVAFASAPTTTFTSFQTPYTADQNITLTCSATDSNCYTTSYRIDSGSWTTVVGGASRYVQQKSGVWQSVGGGTINYPQVQVIRSVTNPTTISGIADLNSFDTEDQIRILDNAGTTILASCSFVGRDCNFSSPFTFQADTNYKLIIQTSGGGTLNYNMVSGVTFPYKIPTTDLNIIGQGYCNLGNNQCASYTPQTGFPYTAFYILNGGTTTTTNFKYSGVGSHTIDYNSTSIGASQEATNTGSFSTIGEASYPTLTYTLLNQNGFVNDLNVPFIMTCDDNWAGDLNYTLYLNDTNAVYSTLDANHTTIASYVMLPNTSATKFTFSCTNTSGNQTLVKASTLYAVQFRLVNEASGALLTQTDVNREFSYLRAYTVDGNSSKDFNLVAGASIANFIGVGQTVYFQLAYRDSANTTINRQINFNYVGDYNVSVCSPFYQTFYQQRFTANSGKGVVLKNNVSGCYVLADTLQYVYDTGFSNTTYTIAKPYYLYTWTTGVKSFLAFIDGAVSTSYNIDAIEFSRSNFTLAVGKDTVAFSPLLNPTTHAYDTNTLQIYYKSFNMDNVRVVMTIMNGSQTIWTESDTNSPNELLVNFLYTGLGVTDQNVLKLVVTTFDASDKSIQTSYYFTINGSNYLNKVDNSWAVIVAVLFFLFGITLVSVGRIFGFFGIIVCLVSIALSAYATNAWWVSLIQVGFVITLIYIILSGKQTGGGVDII